MMKETLTALVPHHPEFYNTQIDEMPLNVA